MGVLKKKFYVTIRFDNDKADMITITSNLMQNAVDMVTKSVWIKCEESDRFINMSKVQWFQVIEDN